MLACTFLMVKSVYTLLCTSMEWPMPFANALLSTSVKSLLPAVAMACRIFVVVMCLSCFLVTFVTAFPGLVIVVPDMFKNTSSWCGNCSFTCGLTYFQ